MGKFRGGTSSNGFSFVQAAKVRPPLMRGKRLPKETLLAYFRVLLDP